MSESPMSGRRKSRASVTNGAPPQGSTRGSSSRSFASTGSDYPSGRQPRGSVVKEEGDFPSGRQPRGSVVMEGDYPAGRKPRASVIEEDEFVEEEVIVEKVATTEDEEAEAKRRRKRLAILVACCLTIILIIIIIVILLGVLGTGDGPSEVPIGGVPENCVANNETQLDSKEQYICDLMTSLTNREANTYLRSYPGSSPYGMALGWMTKTDRTDFANTPQDNVLERFVMTLFYFMTGGKDWFTKFDFLTQEHLCDWTGDSTSAIRCAFADDRKITDLGIPQNGMTGELPSEIGYLTALTRIYFSINQLSGKVPPQISLLTNLQKLYLDRNNFRGKIPDGINDLNLTTLYVDNNDFNGNLTDLCDQATAVGLEFDYHADCETGRVSCPCCTTCV